MLGEVAIDWTWYSIALAGCALAFLYGLGLQNSPSDEDRRRGVHYAASAAYGLVYGIAVAAAIWTTSRALGIDPDLSAAVERYDALVNATVEYAMQIAQVSRDLQLTVLLAPLTNVWVAASWLSQYCVHALLFFFAAMGLVAKLMSSAWGALLLSVGIAMVAVERLRPIGGPFVSSVCVLTCYSAWVPFTPYAEYVLGGRQFYYPGTFPNPGELLRRLFEEALGQPSLFGAVLEDGAVFAEALAFYGMTLSIALVLAAGLSRALGGLATSLSARV